MLTFIIPLKSAQLASKWDRFSRIFERTLKSVCNQDNDNFHVIVACHELPAITYTNDKVEYIQVPFEPPVLLENDSEENRQRKECDKAKKILLAYEKAKLDNTDYIMVVDADDCISNSIVSFVEKQERSKLGWHLAQGYIYKEGSKFMFLNKKTFWHTCGTSLIIKTSLFPQFVVNDPFLHYRHSYSSLSNGKSLEPFPFPGAIYSIGNGENHFMSAQHAMQLAKNTKYEKTKFLKNIYHKLHKYRFRLITKGFKGKFNFYPILNN